uniref:Uncharacterized protein n=1 Tax=Cucumis melo TaxID=3656 RepID=A0A9I9EM27_CUCME
MQDQNDRTMLETCLEKCVGSFQTKFRRERIALTALDHKIWEKGVKEGPSRSLKALSFHYNTFLRTSKRSEF